MALCRTTRDRVSIGSDSEHVEIINKVSEEENTKDGLDNPYKYYGGFVVRLPPERSDSKTVSFVYESPAARSVKDEAISPKRRAFKNLIVLSSAFMFISTAFVSLQSLQSTLNWERGIGVASLSCVYGATVLSCFFVPAVIGKLTTKWTIVVAFTLCLVYISTNFYPRGYVLIPSAVLLGLLTGPLWSAQSTYLTTLAIHYAQSAEQIQDITINKFNGIFSSIFQTGQIWGNIITAAILADNNTVYSNPVNLTQVRLHCGASDCGRHEDLIPGLLGHTVAYVPQRTRNILLSIHLGCALMGIVLATSLLDRTSILVNETSRPVSLSSAQLFYATVKMLQDFKLQLLLPLVTFTGLEQAFVFGDFTKSYVNCGLGIHKIGPVMICFGAVNALSALSIGQLAKHIKRFPIIVAGAFFNAGILIALLWWKPLHDDVPMFYVISACLGICDAIWQTQTNTLFGVLFSQNQEAAFATYRMFQAIGFAAAYGYSYFLCVEIKVYIMGSVLVISLLLYSIIEIKLQKTKKHSHGIVVL